MDNGWIVDGLWVDLGWIADGSGWTVAREWMDCGWIVHSSFHRDPGPVGAEELGCEWLKGREVGHGNPCQAEREQSHFFVYNTSISSSLYDTIYRRTIMVEEMVIAHRSEGDSSRVFLA